MADVVEEKNYDNSDSVENRRSGHPGGASESGPQAFRKRRACISAQSCRTYHSVVMDNSVYKGIVQ